MCVVCITRTHTIAHLDRTMLSSEHIGMIKGHASFVYDKYDVHTLYTNKIYLILSNNVRQRFVYYVLCVEVTALTLYSW